MDKPQIVYYKDEFVIKFEKQELRLPLQVLSYLDDKVHQFMEFVYEDQGLTDLDGNKIILKKS